MTMLNLNLVLQRIEIFYKLIFVWLVPLTTWIFHQRVAQVNKYRQISNIIRTPLLIVALSHTKMEDKSRMMKMEVGELDKTDFYEVPFLNMRDLVVK